MKDTGRSSRGRLHTRPCRDTLATSVLLFDGTAGGTLTHEGSPAVVHRARRPGSVRGRHLKRAKEGVEIGYRAQHSSSSVVGHKSVAVVVAAAASTTHGNLWPAWPTHVHTHATPH